MYNMHLYARKPHAFCSHILSMCCLCRQQRERWRSSGVSYRQLNKVSTASGACIHQSDRIQSPNRQRPVHLCKQFDSNNADHGAAVRLTLSGDKSSSDSGATGPLVSFEDCLFTNNTADFTGGAIGTCNSSWHVSQ